VRNRRLLLQAPIFVILQAMTPKEIFAGIGKEPLLFHHAYLIAGEREAVLSDVLAFLGTIKELELRGNPDLHIEHFDTLSIADARRLKERAERKAFGIRKVFILAFNAATSEAQNALLKVLEDPAEHTHFFLVVPRSDVLLATVRSRLFIAESGPTRSGATSERAKEFLKASAPERLKIAKQIAEEISDGDTDKQFAVDFVSRLEQIISLERNVQTMPTTAFEDVALCRKYITDTSASVKMLLEHLALVLPHPKA